VRTHSGYSVCKLRWHYDHGGGGPRFVHLTNRHCVALPATCVWQNCNRPRHVAAEQPKTRYVGLPRPRPRHSLPDHDSSAQQLNPLMCGIACRLPRNGLCQCASRRSRLTRIFTRQCPPRKQLPRLSTSKFLGTNPALPPQSSALSKTHIHTHNTSLFADLTTRAVMPLLTTYPPGMVCLPNGR